MFGSLRLKGASQTVEDPAQAVNGLQGHLPPRTFAAANKSKRRRACYQVTIGVSLGLLMLWPLFVYGLPAAFLSVSYTTSGATANEFCSRDRTGFSFFIPDLVMGNFTLGQAKAIDLCWNTVLGRGGQAIMGISSYSVITSALMRIAEVSPVKFELFAGLAFDPTGVFTIGHLFKGLANLQGWRPKFAVIWLLFSSLLILAFPSLSDASTGYIQPQALFYIAGYANGTHGAYYSASEAIPNDLLAGKTSETDYICRPDATYQWGFASGFFLIMISLIPVWFFGTYCLWLDAQHNSELTRKGRTMGVWRAVADIAEAMTLELGPRTSGYSNKELHKVLKNCSPIKYDAQVDENGMSHISLTPGQSERLKLFFEATYN
jgi:hypothetical protein